MGTIKTTFSNNIDATGKLKEGSLGFSAGTSWQAVKTSDFTAVAGEGYFVNTTSGAITVTLPSSPTAGDAVVLKDYARTWGTNAVTIASTLVDGNTSISNLNINGQTVTLVYIDGTKGWTLVNEDTTSQLGPKFITATGGTVTESGDYKIHTFTGDGCFVVSCGGNDVGSNSVDYVVVAGGGGGGQNDYPEVRGTGGGGAGGFREGYNPGSYTASPLATTALPVSATTYPITVGAGGAAGPTSFPAYPTPTPDKTASAGSNSIFSTITSAGGGFGAAHGQTPGGTGGSGGGGYNNEPGGAGNTPPVSPPQGNSGGTGSPNPSSPPWSGGGGGGATAAGGCGTAPTGGAGGAGATSSINATPTARAGGGGGGGGTTAGTGGTGGGGAGSNNPSAATAGTANTGGGGGASGVRGTAAGAGGSGIVIIRYKYQ